MLKGLLVVFLAQGALGGFLITESRSSANPECCLVPGLLSCKPITIDPSQLGQSLNILDDAPLEFEGHINDNPDSYSYKDGKGNEAVIHYDPNTAGLNGHLTTADGRSIIIQNCAKDGHVLKDLDLTALQDYPYEVNTTEASASERMIVSDTTTIVTYSVKVYYTPLFAQMNPDVKGFVDTCIDETNQGYINSNVPLRIKLLCTEQTDISEAQSMERPDDLSEQQLNEFATMKGSSAATRDTADTAVLLVQNGYWCGLAPMNSIWNGQTLSVTRAGCARGHFTFAHEIGHNIGLGHNIEINFNSYFPSGYGHIIDAGKWSTILAYSLNREVRVNYYSNPSVTFPLTGSPTGLSSANNAAVLVQQRFALAALGDESSSCGRSFNTPRCAGGDTSFEWDNCCTPSTPCGRGEGDCDYNWDCKDGLTCGTDNCRTFIPGAHQAADCCE